jgi:hypothetical protein
MLECRTVSSRRELAAWIGLTNRVYAETPQFVPPVRQQLRDFHSGKAPHCRFGGVELLSVVRDGDVVARTTAHTNTKLDARLGARHLLFGFTEFVDEDDAFSMLATELDERARRIGATRLLGPVNLLPNQSGGVIVSGFDDRGFVDSPYNHAYYPDVYERNGFERMFEGETFLLPGLEDGPGLPPFDADRLEREGLALRSVNRKRVKDELVLLRRMLNESFAQRAYYTEIDEDELAYQVEGLGYLLDERIAMFLLKHGEPIGFVLCIPDISPFVRDVNGNLGPLQQLRLLATRARYRREAILVIQGIVPSEQGQGYLGLLFGRLLQNLREAGYHTMRGTFVEHDNVASSSYADRLGRPLHGVTFYTRAVT